MFTYLYFLFSKNLLCSLLNISMNNHDNLLHHKNFRGTYSSVEMLKGYMARERLGSPALSNSLTVFCVL